MSTEQNHHSTPTPADQPPTIQPPPATGVRLEWFSVPERVRDAVEQWLGSSVVSAASQAMGFSPGVAARLRIADGRQVFVKAIGPEPNPDSPAIHRREARIASALPIGGPIPRLLSVYDEGEGGWVTLVFEDVEGQHPAQPWRSDELERVLDALVALGDYLTPSPIPASDIRTASHAFRTTICGWKRLVEDEVSRLDHLDAWSKRHLDALIELEDKAPAAADGNTLLHFDIRADNILLTPERVVFVDWPHACIGAAWIDAVFFAPSVTMQDGPPPEQIVERHPTYRAADHAAITAVVAALAGFFIHRSLQPPPPGLPTLRAFQAAQGVVAREWLARLTGWK